MIPFSAKRFKQPLLRVLCSVAISLALGGPTQAQSSIDQLPRLGDPSGDELSPQAERQLGESIMRQIRRDPAFLDDAEATDFLAAFSEALLATPAAAGQRFQFFLIDDGSINAFALPGGFIGVHTGLIAASQSESELASVLAHEIAHVTQRHVVRMLAQQRRASMISMATMALTLLAARSNPQAAMGGMMLGDHVMRASSLSFSRDAEREADRLGLEMLRQAGFEPQGMSVFFNRLQVATRVYETQAPAWLRTHPLTTDRIADIDLRLQDMPQRPRTDSLAFRLIQARLRATLDSSGAGRQMARERAELAVREPASAVGSPSSARGPQVEDWFGLACIAAAQGDTARMTQALDRARALLETDHPGFARLEAAAKLEAGDAKAALELTRAALARFPGQRALVRLQAQALLALREAAPAVVVLQAATRQWPQDDALWLMLSKAHELEGLRARAHRAAAERFVILGSYMAAVDQLRRAQRERDPDFYTASIIDARLRELEPAARRELEESRQMGRERMP